MVKVCISESCSAVGGPGAHGGVCAGFTPALQLSGEPISAH